MKDLKSLTRDEHRSLKDIGMLWEFFPEATGNYNTDAGIVTNDPVLWKLSNGVINDGVYSEKSFSVLYSEDANVDDVLKCFGEIYTTLGFTERLHVSVTLDSGQEKAIAINYD